MAIELSDPWKFAIGGTVGLLVGGFVAFKVGKIAAAPALRRCNRDLAAKAAQLDETASALGHAQVEARRAAATLAKLAK
jgi:hypothetical protein